MSFRGHLLPWAFGWLIYLSLKSGLYSGWSKTYRRIFESRYARRWPGLIPVLNGFSSVENYFKQPDGKRSYQWTPDGWKQLFDAISYPERVIVTMRGDCEDRAVANDEIVRENVVRGVWYDREPIKYELLTVVYQRSDGTLGGHTTSLFGFIGEGFDGRLDWGWMDYNGIRVFDSLERVIDDVRLHYAPGGRVLAWGRADYRTLRYAEVKRG